MSDWINGKVEQDFSRARLRGALHAIFGALRRQPTALLPLEEVRSRVFIRGQSDLGFQAVPLERIVGSEGRYADFDRYFLPRTGRIQDRWKSIGRAYYEDINLPPVELYKIGPLYFVRDGNHRISVARQRGQVDIDAHVIELKTDVPITPTLDLDGLVLLEEQSNFLRCTNLTQLRPQASVNVTATGGYLDLIRHINGHRYFLSLERGYEVSWEEATVHWYDTVYLELVGAIRRSDILQAFPARTEADLYLWIMEHRHYLTEQGGQDPGPDQAVIDYATLFGPLKARQQARRRIIPPEERAFMQWTSLYRTRLDATIHLSDPACYDVLGRHIRDHQYYLGQELNRAVSTEEAAASWYDRVFQPVVEALARQQTLEYFPKRTPADLYLLVMDHLSYLKDQGVEIDVAAAVEDYSRRFGTAKTTVLLGALHWARRLLSGALLPSWDPDPSRVKPEPSAP